MKIIIPIIFSAAVILTGCSKMIDDAYLSPNSYSKVEPETLLPQIVASMAGNYAGHGPLNDARYVGAYIQNFSFYLANSTFDAMGYNNGVGDVAQSTWRTHYYDIGQNNQRMMEWAAEQERWGLVGIGKAIEAWGWMLVADYYGEVIVNEAFNTSLTTFNYDSEEAAYDRIRLRAFEALENLNKATADPKLAEADQFFYGGDIEKWKKFANGVLARYYNHFSNKASYKPDSAIYYADRAMTTIADNASVKFAATALSATNNFFGPLRANFAGTTTANPTGIRQAAYIANMLNGINPEFAGVPDPRAWYMLRGNTNGTIVGVASGAGQAVLAAADRPENFHGITQNPTASNTSPANDQNCRFIFRNNSPIPVMTAAEMKFIKAEAAFKKGDKATSLQAFKDGINSHFDMLTTVYNLAIPAGKEITTANRNAYLSNPAIVPTDPNALTLTKIMMQKYIAMFGHGILETWMDMRRYHYTDIDPQTNEQVYRGYALNIRVAGNQPWPGNPSAFVYRYYPRFNSENVWNQVSLQKIGAAGEGSQSYHTKTLWIVQP
ncbi:SusD/RagB family nutrient-binding outer membrane lipoprotein [Niabella hibiscisoli]|uniref:SusD/RagB family nutrient-binding outer membrane lipoprotein n=1 Tax=Niabella hibiscisoli TaxID=1825928 RepID=UPI001F0DF251|nr:SusD/RagB family nutrient-binding outer membrane lipoprotein [Niabella hibiscisoli]MCH5717206.1 SusD/RagB family nutrient-binding outer membrane lipoprotein [Niabella hibiscisoli]